MITRLPRLRTLPGAAVAGVLAVLLSACSPAAEPSAGPDLSGIRAGLKGSDEFSGVRSVTADYWENDLGHGTLKVTLTVDEGSDAETIADEAIGQIWTRWVTDRVRTIDVIVLGTEDVTYTVQRRYNLPGQADELTEQFGEPATP